MGDTCPRIAPNRADRELKAITDTAYVTHFCVVTWQVESVRAERDGLRRRCAALEDKLADVEKFQLSERGRALDRMEQELAAEKMARVELEADRDALQTQLAAALRAKRTR